MRLIDADKILEDKVSNAYISRFEIELAPTVEASEVKYGKWIWQNDICGDRECICSSCRGELPYTFTGGTIDEPFIKKEYVEETDYCPHCGAKMDEKFISK